MGLRARYGHCVGKFSWERPSLSTSRTFQQFEPEKHIGMQIKALICHLYNGQLGTIHLKLANQELTPDQQEFE